MGGDTLESLIADFTEQRAVDWAVRKFEHFDPSWARELAVGETKNEQEYFRRARIVGCIRKLPESMKSGANRPVLVAVVEMKNPLVERTSRQIQFALAKKILQNAVRETAMGLDGFPSQGLHLIEDDPKAEELCRAIHRVLEGSETEMAQTKRKVIVFSAFTDTIDHIRAYVERAFPDRVMTVTGANFSATLAKKCKANFDASFEPQQDDYDILLASDKLSEGFNLNRADVVVNYDIPWNPTRVIQRVGRINRIGKKVFENLYIFNFFPTVVGSSLVQNDKVAMSKMMAIHNILGEDAQIFSLDETPTPSKLYDKLCSLDDGETVSFHTKVKVEFRKATAFLEKHHPEVIEKVDDLPSMVKTAWECGKTQPHATFMFKRSGSSFSVIARTEADGQVTEWGLKDALEQIACTYDTPREEFRPEFWQFTNWKNGDPSPRGVYEELKLYKPKGIPVHGGVPEAVEAVLAIERYRQQLSFQLKRFAGEVAEDIQSFGTIPLRTIKQLALANRMKDGGKALGELVEVLENLLELRGLHYLDAIREQVRASQIVVTIEKH